MNKRVYLIEYFLSIAILQLIWPNDIFMIQIYLSYQYKSYKKSFQGINSYLIEFSIFDLFELGKHVQGSFYFCYIYIDFDDFGFLSGCS